MELKLGLRWGSWSQHSVTHTRDTKRRKDAISATAKGCPSTLSMSTCCAEVVDQSRKTKVSLVLLSGKIDQKILLLTITGQIHVFWAQSLIH